MDFYQELAEAFRKGEIKTKEDLERWKSRLAKKYRMLNPRNSEIMRRLPEDIVEKYHYILVKKPSRTLSGVAIVAIMTSPFPCPHGKCIYCPGGPDKGTAQSYTGHEPAAMRAAQHNFDPYEQTKARIEQLNAIGHPTDKIDLIIMGGTFTARPRRYQEWFVKRAFDAMNETEARNLEEAHLINESAKNRCIGLTVETRPDWFMEREIDFALYLGATRVELGIQTVYDDILEFVKRGHTVRESILSTRLAKDAGFKINYHMMPGLPGSTLERDFEAFKEIFKNPDFRPDMLKIYPTLVVKGTELYEMWKRGEYEPYTLEEMIELLVNVISIVPPWIRIQRIQRDIPAKFIEAGVKRGDLRALVMKEMKNRGIRCPEIRCREVGRKGGESFKIRRRDYDASQGKEVFLSFEDDDYDSIAAYLRLRLPSEYAHRPEMLDAAIVREVKVFGKEVPVGEREDKAWQHRGFGRKLMEEAERIATEEWDVARMVVISGVGVRDYYRKLGYERLGPYMAKKL
ncbi:tRNA uridine(34) 5-carboxymethylaminomethyl modification radical SAM/GNAT enzyme Elp3 [Euryarchaeota archaeon ex4484_178]|nr:MAG: tRNA uridine(34) 5-carboxymethylaminomethyl modification radical SAM/GNAT enzyme Elp3 [Euryarchaeota archaeon ex4484_178]